MGKKKKQSTKQAPSRTVPASPRGEPAGRPPVVAVLGHVDHGKTSLLDAIRKTDVARREHGGITQAIGAYQIEVATKEGAKKITFIDTPGHEAFAKMRARGTNASDTAILVVAADDGVMPQTKESIAHIKEANLPFVVALTKSDLPSAIADKVKQQLIKAGVTLEGLGGDVPVVAVSSKTGKGISDLLEVILLVGQMANIQGSPAGEFEGVVIEAKRDRRKGVLATVIVKNGTLAVGDEVFAQHVAGKVRALFTDIGQSVREALPSTPVGVLGFSDVPSVGARVTKGKKEEVVANDSQAQRAAETQNPRLAIILKADSFGSLEAIAQSMLSEDIKTISATSGEPTEADVLLAKAVNAIIVGFNVAVPSSVAKLAESEGVLIKTYKLIYELIEEILEAVALFKKGKAPEAILGKAKVLAIFPYEGKKVAGCKVLEGRIAKGDKVKIERDGQILGEGRIASLRRGKEDITKAEMGSECGILLSASLDFAPSDMLLSVRYG